MTWKGRGNNKVQDDRTGAIVHASDCRMTWNGLFTAHWFPRNPQDTNFPIKEGMPPAISRPIGEPTFIATPQNQPASWGDGTGITWGDGTGVEWSENEVAETDL